MWNYTGKKRDKQDWWDTIQSVGFRRNGLGKKKIRSRLETVNFQRQTLPAAELCLKYLTCGLVLSLSFSF